MSVKYHLGEVIPSHFDPSIVAGSCIASLCGCYLTVELLHRRETGLKTWKGWRDTLFCATALALCGIWCMHFIGNRAIILGDGETDIQLVYDPAYSVLSVVLPVIGLSIAFAVAEVRFRSQLWRSIALIGTGVFAGLSIVGMHYMGNFGIKNYDLDYQPRFFWVSIFIAIGDCLTVLHLFYSWRDKWISDARKRFLCATALAGGVSAMHFTASTNCIYKLKLWSTWAARQSRNVQVIVAGTLCGGAIITAFGVLVFFHIRTEQRQRGSKKVMISCAIFDSAERILVTTEGILPSREITDKFNSRTFAEEFDTAHPVYQWIFRITRNWSSISELIPQMRSHLRAHGTNGDIWSSIPTTATSFELETCTDYSLLLRERFCVAAASLASYMHLPVEKIGVLYDSIVDTGTLITDESARRRSRLRTNKVDDDLETGNLSEGLGKGQLLFLTRHVNESEVDKLLNAGFKFGSVQQIGRKIAQNMQISFSSLEAHIGALKRYNNTIMGVQKKNGTFLGCFVMVPRPNSKGFEVVVKRSDQSQLPDVRILPKVPALWQADLVESMHGKTTAQCIAHLGKYNEADDDNGEHKHQLATTISSAITSLNDQLPPGFLPTARFYGRPLYPHYAHSIDHTSPTITLYCFVACADLHTPINSLTSHTRTPLSFFRVRHQCYSGSPHFGQLEREIHKEFGPLLARRITKSSDRVKKLTRMSNGSTENIVDTRPASPVGSDDKSDFSFYVSHERSTPKLATKRTRQSSVTATMQREPFGGILVNNETVIESDQKSDDYDDKTLDIGLGVRAEVGIGTIEPEKTFVDELCAFTRTIISSRCAP